MMTNYWCPSELLLQGGVVHGTGRKQHEHVFPPTTAGPPTQTVDNTKARDGFGRYTSRRPQKGLMVHRFLVPYRIYGGLDGDADIYVCMPVIFPSVKSTETTISCWPSLRRRAYILCALSRPQAS